VSTWEPAFRYPCDHCGMPCAWVNASGGWNLYLCMNCYDNREASNVRFRAAQRIITMMVGRGWIDERYVGCADCCLSREILNEMIAALDPADGWLSGACADGNHGGCPRRSNDLAPCRCECNHPLDCAPEERPLADWINETRSLRERFAAKDAELRKIRDQFEIVGKMADKAENCIYAASLPVPLTIHVQCLTEALRDIRDELHGAYFAVVGVDCPTCETLHPRDMSCGEADSGGERRPNKNF
jgi:hypothetical protein